MRPLSNDKLRQLYLNNQDECWRLLSALRARTPLTEPERQALWLLLSDNVNDATWKLYGKGKRAAKRFVWHGAQRWWHQPKNVVSRRGYDEHVERVLILAEHIRTYKTRNPYLPPEEAVHIAIVAYKRRFLWLEIIRQYAERGFNLRQNGVAFPTILININRMEKLLHPNNDIKVAMQRWYDEEFNLWRECVRAKSIAPHAKKPYKYPFPTQKRADNFQKKLEEYVQLKNIVYRTISWDALGEVDA